MKPIVRVEGSSKQYRIGARTSYDTVYESVFGFARSPWSLIKRNGNRDAIWALKNVSFEVEAGEAFGIIGRSNFLNNATYTVTIQAVQDASTTRYIHPKVLVFEVLDCTAATVGLGSGRA